MTIPTDWEKQTAACHHRQSRGSLELCVHSHIIELAVLAPSFEVLDGMAVPPVGFLMLEIPHHCAISCLWILALSQHRCVSVLSPHHHPAQESGESSGFVPGESREGKFCRLTTTDITLTWRENFFPNSKSNAYLCTNLRK